MGSLFREPEISEEGGLCTLKNHLKSFTMAWMELETIMLSEVSQSVKDKYHMISLTRGI